MVLQVEAVEVSWLQAEAVKVSWLQAEQQGSIVIAVRCQRRVVWVAV